MTPLKNPAAVALGRLGGASKSSAKAKAARANGRLGGRPRKQQKPPLGRLPLAATNRKHRNTQ